MSLPPAAVAANPALPGEFAWKVHATLEAWTARADLKASVLLAFQGGAFVLAVSWSEVLFGGNGWGTISVAVAGVVCLLLAVVVAAAVVLPNLGSSPVHRAEREGNLIYFGHLRLWRSGELTSTLLGLTPAKEAEMLALQLIRLSRLTWRKHRLLQVSVALTCLAVILLTGAALVVLVG